LARLTMAHPWQAMQAEEAAATPVKNVLGVLIYISDLLIQAVEAAMVEEDTAASRGDMVAVAEATVSGSTKIVACAVGADMS
jgi:hypothetical protein